MENSNPQQSAVAVIDLRSDTVTRPSPAMRQAMAQAEVGDDVYGEDPTVITLQTRAAALTGKEAALFVPSGVMANQIAIKIHTEPGDDIIVGEGAHTYLYESGAGAAISGCMFSVVGQGGLFSAEDVVAAIKPPDSHYARTRLVCVENTHNRSGGRVFPQAAIERIAEVARASGLALHLDGARVWNAHVATGLPISELARPFDTISFCLSKGLGAPVGSLLCGTRALITKAHRIRKMLGGGMRQVGILAAAGLYALEHSVPRLAEDHKSARAFAGRLHGQAGLGVDLASVETNIVNFDLDPATGLSAAELVKRLREPRIGVLVNAIAPQRLRAVTHLDVTLEQAALAADRIVAMTRGLR